ncbi:MAG: DUF5666 domain-containing protein [Dehalococcoidia bacterium]|nr:DUF5666 domain-containing protein [Dehalococcoidia bacterium]
MMKIPAGPRFKYGWVVFLASLATLSLVSCATITELATKSPIVETATQAPSPTVSNTPIPPAPSGIRVVVVGIVREVDGDFISVQTLEGSTSVHLTADSVIQEFAASSLKDLDIGQRVTAMGQETESGIAARAVIVSLENTSLFQDQGDFQLGRAGRALVGTIEKIDDGSIMINTKLGSRTATIDTTSTAFMMPAPVSTERLSRGQLVTVTGIESSDGGITAQSVLITPELGGLMSAGRTGGRGGRGGRGGGQGQGPPPSSGTVAAPPDFDTERKTGAYDGITFVVTEDSGATFRVREQLALIPLPHHAEMHTTALSGDIHLDGRPSSVVINLHQLKSDQRFRDRYVRNAMFPDDPKAIFTLLDVGALPQGFPEGKEVKAQIAGTLNIRGAEFPLGFNVTVQDKGDVITILGRTKFS